MYEFNLPAGHSCPWARACKTSADRNTGKQTFSPNREFRCYAAQGERYPAVRKARWENYDGLLGKSREEMAKAILEVFPTKSPVNIRIHGSGDFFSQSYFDAWLDVCLAKPEATSWAFTKSVRFWVARLGKIPTNLTLQASYGGIEDNLISEYGLKYARVFPDRLSAEASGLPIDTDDTLAMRGSRSFALIDRYAKRGVEKQGKFDFSS